MLDAPPPPSEQARYEQASARAREELGEAAFAEVWAAGQALPMEEVISEAQEFAAALAAEDRVVPAYAQDLACC